MIGSQRLRALSPIRDQNFKTRNNISWDASVDELLRLIKIQADRRLLNVLITFKFWGKREESKNLEFVSLIAMKVGKHGKLPWCLSQHGIPKVIFGTFWI